MLAKLARGCAEQLRALRTLQSAPSACWPAGTRGLAVSPSGVPPAAGTETEFNGEPIHNGRAPPSVSLSAVPALPRMLGLLGAIPFLALSPPVAALLPLMPADLLANAGILQVGYGASILSFLGGIHWALAMAEYGGPARSAAAADARYMWSVTPCLVAWPAVSLATGPASLVIAGTLGIAYGVDRSFASKGLLPSWYMALRLPLTLAAVTGMSLTLVSSVMDSEAAVGPEAARAAPSVDRASFAGESPGLAGGPQEMQLAGVREKE